MKHRIGPKPILTKTRAPKSGVLYRCITSINERSKYMAAYVLYVGITENCDQRRNKKRQTKSQRTVCNMLISFRPVRRRMAPGTTRLHIGVTRSPTATHSVLQTQSPARLRTFVLLSY